VPKITHAADLSWLFSEPLTGISPFISVGRSGNYPVEFYLTLWAILMIGFSKYFIDGIAKSEEKLNE